MPRPSLGRQARKVSATLRITRIEEEWLVENYGTVGTGLRHALDTLIARDVPTVTPEPIEEGKSRHLCRVFVDEQYEYVRGTPTLVSKTCGECGRVVNAS